MSIRFSLPTLPFQGPMKQLVFLCLVPFMLVLQANGQSKTKADELSEWAHYLASDAMKGRANGSNEMKLAAQYIADKFKEFGLAPLPEMDGYFQNYSFNNRRGTEIQERNVIGYLEGSDPQLKNEFIIYSSHFDHVGIGRVIDGDSIYNGANDNVAGTVTIMGLAKLWNDLGIRPARSVIFAAFSGEEMGIKGSGHFMKNLPFEASRIFFNFNIEMTGHCTILGPKTYYITGPSYTNLDDILDEYNKQSDWIRTDQEKNADGLFFASDNIAFAVDRTGEEMKLNIPAHTFCTHGGEKHIHLPNDEPQFMNYENMADLVHYLSGLGLSFGKMERGTIQWDQKAFKEAMNSRRR